MQRTPSMSLMAIVFLSVIFGAHAYVAWRMTSTIELGKPYTALIWAMFSLMALVAPLSMIYARLYLSVTSARTILWGAYLWLGTFFILFSLTVAIDLFSALMGLGARLLALDSPTDDSRRLHTWRMIRSGQVALAGLGTWHAVWTARKGPVIERVSVTLKRLPKALDGFTIAQISDLHVASLLRREYVVQDE